MFDNYFFLKRLSVELEKDLKGLKLIKSVSQSRNELVTGFFSDKKEKFLIFTFQKLPPLLYVKDNFSFAKRNFADFFEILSENELISITIDDYERNIRFKFLNHELIYLFRGNHSNVVLIDETETIIESFKKSTELVNRKFSEIFVVSDLDYSFFEDEQKFNSLFTDGSSEKRKYLKIIGNTLLEEIKFRSEEYTKSYFHSFEEIQNEINEQPLKIYEDDLISFCELNSLKKIPKTSSNLFEDLSRIYFSIQKNEDITNFKEKILKKLKTDYEYHFKKLQELRKPENFIDRSEEFRQVGNLILINAHQIKKGNKILKTEFEEKDYKIQLNPTKTPFQNAEEYFEKAREEESRLDSLRKLITKEEKRLEQIKDAIDEIESSTDRKQLMKFLNEQNQQSQEKEIKKHFRHFLIDGKYDVYIGKDSKSNDILTTQFANPDDLWFHARGVSGSHVIIRRTNRKETIPKDIIQKVASIAAFYSKAKNSKLVPVAYTEKKYVIKRKGMSPGTVQLQKEKVIMVEPKNPEQLIEGHNE